MIESKLNKNGSGTVRQQAIIISNSLRENTILGREILTRKSLHRKVHHEKLLDIKYRPSHSLHTEDEIGDQAIIERGGEGLT